MTPFGTWTRRLSDISRYIRFVDLFKWSDKIINLALADLRAWRVATNSKSRTTYTQTSSVVCVLASQMNILVTFLIVVRIQ